MTSAAPPGPVPIPVPMMPLSTARLNGPAAVAVGGGGGAGRVTAHASSAGMDVEAVAAYTLPRTAAIIPPDMMMANAAAAPLQHQHQHHATAGLPATSASPAPLMDTASLRHRVLEPADRPQFPVFYRESTGQANAARAASMLLQTRGAPWSTGGGRLAADSLAVDRLLSESVAAHEPTSLDDDVQPTVKGRRVEQLVPGFYQPPPASRGHNDNIPSLSATELNILVMHAARIGDTAALRSLVRSPRLDVNMADDEGRTALMFASIGGHGECLQLLVGCGAVVHQADFSGRSALHWVARFGHAGAAALLLRAGANILSTDFQGKSALHCAATNDRVDTMRILLRACGGRGSGASKKLSRLLAPVGSLSPKPSSSSSTQPTTPSPTTVSPTAAGTDHSPPSTSVMDCRDDDAMTPLMWAAAGGHTEQCRYLIDAGARVDLADVEGRTALHWAMSNRHAHVIMLLVETHRPLTLVRDIHGRLPVHLACAAGNIGAVYYLMGVCSECLNNSAPDESGRTAVHCATINGRTAVLKLLSDVGAKLSRRDRFGATPLHYAAQLNFRDCVHILLRRGASVAAVDEIGRQPLAWASIQGHVQVCKVLLVDGKADVNARQEHGLTALHFAAFAGHTACVLLLLRHGADIDAVDGRGHTPLYRAAMAGNAEVVLSLLTEGAAVDLGRDVQTGGSALHVAAGAGHVDVVNLLTAYGADAQLRDLRGATALHESAFHGRPEVLMFLLSNNNNNNNSDNTNANANSGEGEASPRDIDGVTPLHWAAVGGHVECCRLLLAHGASVNAMVHDTDRDTPLDYAYLNGNFECAQLLVENGAPTAVDLLHRSARHIQRCWRKRRKNKLQKPTAKAPATLTVARPYPPAVMSLDRNFRRAPPQQQKLDRLTVRGGSSLVDPTARVAEGVDSADALPAVLQPH